MKKWEKIEEWFRCLVIRGLRLIQQTRYKKTRSSVFCNYAIIIILYYIILLLIYIGTIIVINFWGIYRNEWGMRVREKERKRCVSCVRACVRVREMVSLGEKSKERKRKEETDWNNVCRNDNCILYIPQQQKRLFDNWKMICRAYNNIHMYDIHIIMSKMFLLIKTVWFLSSLPATP